MLKKLFGIFLAVVLSLSLLAQPAFALDPVTLGAANAYTNNAIATAPISPATEIVIAASNSTAYDKAHANYVCTGTTSLSATMAGSHISPTGAFTSGQPFTVSTAGSFTVTLAAGQTAVATSRTATVTGSPLRLVAGTNTVTTTTTGTFYIQGMGDDAVIQNAINSLETASPSIYCGVAGRIHLDGGTYYLANSIAVTNNSIWIDGSGEGATELQESPYTGGGFDMVQYYSPASATCSVFFFNMSNLNILGMGGSYEANDGIHEFTNGSYTTSDMNLDHVYVEYCANWGIEDSKPWGARITNCLFENCGLNGTTGGGGYITNVGYDTYLSGDFFSINQGLYGLEFGDTGSTSSGATIENCQFYNNTGTGIYINGYYNTLNSDQFSNNSNYGVICSTSYNNFSGCSACSNTDAGWDISGKHNTIASATAMSSGHDGFLITGADNALSCSESFLNNTSNGSYADYHISASYNILDGDRSDGGSSPAEQGFLLDSSASYCLLSACEAISDATSKDFYISTGCGYNTIYGCWDDSAGHTDSGTSTLIAPALT